MRRILHLLYSIAGAVLVASMLIYLAGIANLSLRGVAGALWKSLPTVLITAGCIGLLASVVRPHGCLTALVAGMSTFVGEIATVLAVDPTSPVGIQPVEAYFVGIPIGVLFGVVWLAVWSWWHKRENLPRNP